MPVVIRTLCVLLLGTWLASCKRAPEVPFNASGVKSSLTPRQSGHVGALLQDYLSLKDGLVATDHQMVYKSAINMREQLRVFQTLNGVASQGPPASMEEDLGNIIAHKDGTCEMQRVYFKRLSDSLYTFVQNIAATNLHLYHYYCPMALNGKGGAWWLSASRKVENPYFGSKMLTCGELVDTLQ